MDRYEGDSCADSGKIQDAKVALYLIQTFGEMKLSERVSINPFSKEAIRSMRGRKRSRSGSSWAYGEYQLRGFLTDFLNLNVHTACR